MQPLDFTTLTAICSQLRTNWLPARTEQVYQRDRHTISLALRTMKKRDWLDISWHPQATRICIGEPPPRIPDTFTFSHQLVHQLGGLALVAMDFIAPWERVIDLKFARRPGESPLYHLYVEIMGKYSNVILTDAKNEIITAAHQVSQQQSSVRPIQTGQPYEIPPKLTGNIPNLTETEARWQERVSLVPGSIKKQILKSYSGVSAALLDSLLLVAHISPETTTTSLTNQDWSRLFAKWQEWLRRLEEGNFKPGWTNQGYTVMGWGEIQSVENIQELINQYYTQQLNQQGFYQLRHQLNQKLQNILGKLNTKAKAFKDRLEQSEDADKYKQQADLLMAHLHQWQPGMTEIILPDFETDQPQRIVLEADKNAVQNAQRFYKQHQKLKRARNAVYPLLLEVNREIEYLEQVEAAINQIDSYQTKEDLEAIEEIRDELIEQKYLEELEYRRPSQSETVSHNFHHYRTPSGLEILIGRNNHQNDYLTFRVAGDYDLWFHAQEIPGSHVLLRLPPGTVPEEADLKYTANIAAYFSRARHSEQVPVVYTRPNRVYKPKGAKPGLVIYKQEKIIWGNPGKISQVINHLQQGV
ncbi:MULTISPECIES: NFACT family protein [Cylindrospermopsis]|uniref:Rqc2 family fibronectin-binding protein n=1 Tax=Cylindrospermopsis TaxID=77021 RepID=UPI0007091302|nr:MULTISPECIES: NFACT RNA binding domain-containing protein [Cylindrospermopsis]MBU6345306.1 NFACT family protein [Cyanobacteria bacterium REEB494]KRH96679.1 fibronectin-binding protein [Cylindrospermopsis sp. CR12]TPX29786.1 fibronectin-binding domain-containing protein [Cylindrospermopsis raciborskii GIHE 2018]UJL32955.1 NFACT family protein [Cylindrospermopsis raciborskii Cr2010]UJS05433.1 NFACT family protein [Cylindrospermopsis raciborskii KLL07]